MMTRYTLFAGLAAAAVAVLAAGCVEPRLTAPDNYIRLSEPGYWHADKVVSADGVYIGVRPSRPAEGGNLDFWTTAVRNQLTGGMGYTLADEGDVTSADGTKGRRMDFSVTLENTSLGYAVALWVLDDRITIAESGGPKDKFDADRAGIEAAFESVRLK